MTWRFADKTELAIEAECFETPGWAVDAILSAEIMTRTVIDPCCGRGVMEAVARRRGYRHFFSSDLYDWGHGVTGIDFLDFVGFDNVIGVNDDQTILMNPPFSLACDFVQVALDRGARKVICFQRHAWYESDKRRAFWETYPPQRVYALAQRAACWRIDIDPTLRGVPRKKGGAGTGTPTAHSWYVWERGQPAGTIMGRLNDEREKLLRRG